MKILVTGAAGQVGSRLVPYLRSLGHEISCFDLDARPPDLDAEIQWTQGSVTDAGLVDETVRRAAPEVVYHLAAILSAKGETNPALTYEVNLEGTRHVLDASLEHRVRQVMFASTIAVFGKGLPEPVPNQVGLRPGTMYGVTKAAGEMLGEYYGDRWGLDFRAVRFPGLINAGVPGGGTTDYALWMYIDAVRYGRYACFVKAESMVPMMDLDDGLRAMRELSEADRDRLRYCVYNIAGFRATAQDFADAARARVPGAEITFEPDPDRQAILDTWPRAVDDSCAQQDWGWKPRYDLDALSDRMMEQIPELLDQLGTGSA